MTEQTLNAFAVLLRQLRTEAGLSPKDLADAAGLHERAISNLERGLVTKPRKDTLRSLAAALGLDGRGQTEFERAAGRPQASDNDPRAWLGQVGAALDDLGVAAAESV